MNHPLELLAKICIHTKSRYFNQT